jgi:hypothetical protein
MVMRHRSIHVPILAFGLIVGIGVMGFASPCRAANAPAVDWEKPWVPQTGADASPYVNPQFTSTKSLAETTAWLKFAIERYGDVPADKYDPNNSFHSGEVRFQGCTMQWVVRRSIENGSVVLVDAYMLALRDVFRDPGGLQVDPRQLKVSVRSSGALMPLRVVETVYHRDDGALKSTGSRREDDNHFYLSLQGTDDIPRRVGTALIHASRLCSTGGAQR